MPKIIPESKLKEAIENQTFIKNGLVGNAEGIKYDFRISSKILKAEFGQPIDVSTLTPKEQADLKIDPGEVVFVLTEETLDLPNNMKAVLSQKRKLAHDGILILGGFCIDPLYCGRLLFGLFNFSSVPFLLKPGKKLIAALFYELEADEVEDFLKPECIIENFPDELVQLMQKYRPVSIQSLLDQIQNLSFKFEELRKEFRDREDWFQRFQDSLESHKKSIDRIIVSLDKEIEQRRESERDFERRISVIYEKTSDNIAKYSREAYKTAGAVGAIGALIISLIIFLIQKLV